MPQPTLLCLPQTPPCLGNLVPRPRVAVVLCPNETTRFNHRKQHCRPLLLPQTLNNPQPRLPLIPHLSTYQNLVSAGRLFVPAFLYYGVQQTTTSGNPCQTQRTYIRRNMASYATSNVRYVLLRGLLPSRKGVPRNPRRLSALSSLDLTRSLLAPRSPNRCPKVNWTRSNPSWRSPSLPTK